MAKTKLLIVGYSVVGMCGSTYYCINTNEIPSELSRGGAKAQVTGQVTGHRSQVRSQVTGQVTGQITGHTKKQ